MALVRAPTTRIPRRYRDLRLIRLRFPQLGRESYRDDFRCQRATRKFFSVLFEAVQHPARDEQEQMYRRADYRFFNRLSTRLQSAGCS
jgi:hypothetical protein